MEIRKILINSEESSRQDDDSRQPEFRVVDKRHFHQEEDGGSPAPAVEEKRYPTYVEELMARVAETERRFAEKVKQMDQEISRSKARLEAEYLRRLARDKQELLLPFLEVLDNLDRALRMASSGDRKDLIEGVKMTAALFRAKLKAQSVEALEVLNQPFDPNVSQAVGVSPVAEPERDGLVVDELLPGYRMDDGLLRPAQVRVAQYQESEVRSQESEVRSQE